MEELSFEAREAAESEMSCMGEAKRSQDWAQENGWVDG